MSQNKIKTEMDELVGFFQSNPEAQFEYKFIEDLLRIQPEILKKLLNILEKENYVKVKYELGKEYYSWNKNKPMEIKNRIEFAELKVHQNKKTVDINENYKKIEELLENLLDKRTKYLKLKEKKENLLKKGRSFALLNVYDKELTELKKEIKILATETKKLIDQLK